MTFYIKPPEGNISLSKLRQDAETRLLFLLQIHQRWGDTDQMRSITLDHPYIRSNSECLIEGSRKDRISHFLLRLASLGSEQFQGFLIAAETQLFEHRLECGDERGIMHSLSELRRHISFALKNMTLTSSHKTFMLQVQKVTKEMLLTGMVKCSAEQTCDHSIQVPWTLVESLVKERYVVVNGGQAKIRCQILLQLLCSVFKSTLDFGIKQLSLCGANDIVVEDHRMNQVKKSLRRLFRKHQGSGCTVLSSSSLRHTDIENQVPYFPLCMQELHKILSSTGRLRHHARIRYTLFLKDIGLPVMENIAFWEDFYCKPKLGHGGGCCHSWEGSDKRRYTYGIRHLYGIEGSRRNYTSHSCTALQTLQPQPLEVGGCPFTSYSEDELSDLFNPLLENHLEMQEAITKEVKAGRPSAACKILLALTIFLRSEDSRRSNKKEKLLHAFDKGNIQDLEEVKSKLQCTANLTDSAVVGLKHSEIIHNIEHPSKSYTDKEKRTDLQLKIPHCKSQHFKHLSSATKCTQVNELTYIENHNLQNFHTSCNGMRNQFHECLCDIEDINEVLPKCNFSRPSHYYLKAKYESIL
ncbi:uncharacterized protein [Procambarus clarkii]|uniref:uncharacterized protein n=1 Tax=Procambarus clarkii TaxID=6728 RepID=UPI001E676F2A|nr:DNA primase large subunit-like [Procambarus clarkii]